MGNKLSKQQQLFAMTAVIFIAVIFVYWSYFLKPVLNDIKKKDEQYKNLVAQVDQAERQAKRLPTLIEEFVKLETELLALEKQLPTDKNIPVILRLLTKEASIFNVNFISLKPSEPRSEPPFYVLEFDMAVNCSIHSFARFITSLGQQDRIFQIEQVRFSLASQVDATVFEPMLNISFKLKTFAYAG